MMSKILIGLVVVVGVFIIVVATRPSQFHVERSLAVVAPPASVFALINDFRAWGAWSPWEKLDPNMERTHSGAPAGVGAMYAWNSKDGKVGQGRMTIERSESPTLVGVKLEFIRPFTATNAVTLEIEPSGTGTKVTWAMDGHNGFVGKMFHLVMNMDKMVGGDFERGLANLKTVAESATAQSPAMAGVAQPR